MSIQHSCCIVSFSESAADTTAPRSEVHKERNDNNNNNNNMFDR